MITKLLIPVNNTDDGKFEYDGNLSRSDYENMVMDNFRRTDRQVDAFMHGRGGYHNPYVSEIDNRDYSELDNDVDVEVEAFLQDSNKNEFNEQTFFDRFDDGRMFVLIVNINPMDIDGNVESEIKYWLDDSYRVWSDDSLDQRTKLLTSPYRDLKIVLSDGNKYRLSNCKVFEDYSDDKFPFYFAMIVEKITEE